MKFMLLCEVCGKASEPQVYQACLPTGWSEPQFYQARLPTGWCKVKLSIRSMSSEAIVCPPCGARFVEESITKVWNWMAQDPREEASDAKLEISMGHEVNR